MGLNLGIFKKLFKRDGEEKKEVGYIKEPVPENAEIIERYWIRKPFARVTIASIPELGGAIKYFVEEIPLRPEEEAVLDKIINIVAAEINPAEFKDENNVRDAMLNMADKIIRKYEKKFKIHRPDTHKKLLYYIERELLGFGPIDVLMKDYNIEDISCDGVDVPVYIWHRKYESIPTNIIFKDKVFLDNFIVKLAHRSGKHVSSAFPIVDAMIYGKHRLAASFREEVSPKGSTFTIRKFREEPYSIIDLIDLGTINTDMAAYFWLLMENKVSMLIIGGTAAGKTTLLNAIATLIKPGYKVVTVEETAEINLPIDNWVQFISRESYGISGAKVGEVTLFDLVKTSLRYRPDYLIVGEVRGEEAFVLFQAVATGHGGLCTIHGESLDAAVKRLTSPPMNVSESYIPLMNVAINIERVVLPKRPAATSYGRRVTYVWEIRDYNDYIPVFEWSPSEDIFYSYIERSILIPRIARKLGLTIDNLLSELRIRAKILEWLKDNGIRSFREVAKYINEFYVDKEKLLKKLGIEIEEEREVAVSEVEEELPSPPVEIDSIPSVEAQPSKIERPVVRRFPYDIAEDVMNKMYKVLKILMGRKGVYTDTDIKTRLNMDDIEFKKIIEVMLKHNLISIEKKRKYSYIRIRKKGIKVYNTLSSHLGK